MYQNNYYQSDIYQNNILQNGIYQSGTYQNDIYQNDIYQNGICQNDIKQNDTQPISLKLVTAEQLINFLIVYAECFSTVWHYTKRRGTLKTAPFQKS